MKTYLFFASRYLPYLGGVERYTHNMSKELVSQGNKVIIVTSSIKGYPPYEAQDNTVIIRLPSLPLLNGRFPVLLYNRQAKKLMSQITDLPIDYAIINTRFYILSYYGVRYTKKTKIPSVVIEHGTGHFTVNNKLFDFCGHIYEHVITHLIKKNCNRFCGVSMKCNEWLRHFSIEANQILYNAVDIQYIQKILDDNDDHIKDIIDYQKDDIIITYTGRLIEEKGILKLISAIQHVIKCYSNVKLCIAGDGNLYNKLLSYNCKNIKVLGRLEFEQVIHLLNITQIYCLPTDYPEGLPTSILEAIACKAYVITTSEGGSKEIIVDNSYGDILAENSVTTIANSIIRIIENEERRKWVVENTFKQLCSNFTWENTVKKLNRIFEMEENDE